jgi:hypothetical protein
LADDFYQRVYGQPSAPANMPMPPMPVNTGRRGKRRGRGSSILAGAVQSAPENTPFKPFKEEQKGAEWWETPIIKQIVDALSTGTYAVGNYTNYATMSDEDARKQFGESVKSGDLWSAAIDVLGANSMGGAIGGGVLKGLSAGFGGNNNDVKTQSDTVRNFQKANNIDPESPESRNVQFWGGLAGDIALDPLNVVGLGAATAATKGAVRGSKQFKAEQALAQRTGKPMAESVAPTRWDNAKKQASVELNKYRQQEYDIQQGKITRKQLKKHGTDADKARYIVENLQTLRPAVLRSVAKTMDDPENTIKAHLDDLTDEDMATMAAKLDDTTPDTVPNDVIPDAAPADPAKYKYEPQQVGLSSVKEPTFAEKVVDTLGEYRTTNRKPIYTPDVIANVSRMVEAEAAKGIPRDKIKNSKFTDLGVEYRHVPLYKTGTELQDIATETSVGDLRAIARDIGNGKIQPENLAPLYEFAGSMEPKAVAAFIRSFSKTDEFKEATKNLNKYGSKRTGETPLPWIGVSGHGKLAIPGKGFTPTDILAAKSPANPDQSRKYLESRYNQSAIELAGNPRGAELRKLADEVFKETIDVQRTPAGYKRSRRGASVGKDKFGIERAKFETKYNTHSAMYRVIRVTDALRDMKFKTQGQYDDAFMQVLRDLDDRLRLAGFDPHLSNMMMQGDKLMVRLGPSDVFGLMSKEDRIRYIHGRKSFREPIKEQLPTTVLDLAEVLVRSATKLTPEGKIDMKALYLNALDALQGKYGKHIEGKREITNNLDIQTLNKNHEEVLRAIDKELETTYVTAFKAASQPEKTALIDLVKKQNPDLFKKILTTRTETVAVELLSKFTKGMADGRPSLVSGLVNTNMRNAAVFGGTVAKQIGETTAEYSQKVLDALDSGTVGDFLSELVSKPPFPIKDSTARQILNDNVNAVRQSVANAEEISHAQALNNNVKGVGNPATNNAQAFQPNRQLTEELAKKPADMNTEKMFDLTLRELNRDILLRAFGTSRWFNKRAGMARSFDVMESSSHAVALIMTGFHSILRNFRAKGWDAETLRVAMKEAQSGQAVSEQSVELQRIMNQLFDPNKNNFLTRNSVGPEHFNKILKEVDFNDNYRVPVDATPDVMNEVWKTWDITHVEDFLSKLMGAMVKTAEDVSMGASFSRHFGSDVPAKGYVKITDPKKLNPLFPLIDQTLYYPVEIAEEMVHIGRLMTESRSFKPGTKTHTFITKVFDKIVSTLKLTQTTMKPGHHVMSITGDIWRNSLALSTIGLMRPGQVTKLYFESAQILKTAVGQIAELDEFQKFQRIQGVTQDIAFDANSKGGALFFSNIGKGGNVSNAKLYAAMQANGIAMPAHLGGIAEDWMTDLGTATAGGTGSKIINAIDKTTTGIDRLVNPLKPKFGAKNPYSLNAFTAHRDTWTRGALFLGAMKSRQFRNLDDAVEFASQFVRKWAPTAVDLAAAETKYARRAIFYYTWIRGMVPRIIESALMRPGIATIPNKAAYEMAKSQGIDLQSIGDPFPDDKLFPSWYTERVIGPQYVSHDGDLWGANPTGPLGDVLNSLGSNVSPKDFVGIDAYTKITGNFLNMSTPWFKVPVELISGHKIEGQAPIKDNLEYLQDMIGPARFASKMQGKELYLAQGPNGPEQPFRTESKYKEGLTPEELQANQLTELLNWGTGWGFTNYTSDSAEKSAQFQEKKRVQDEKNKYDRFEK